MITAALLLAENGGIIEAGQMFPDETEADVLSRLQGYLDEGYSYTVSAGDEDDAAVAWANYKALNAVVLRIAATPATVGVISEGYRTYTGQQLVTLRNEALRWQKQFELFVTAAPEGEWGDVFNSARR